MVFTLFALLLFVTSTNMLATANASAGVMKTDNDGLAKEFPLPWRGAGPLGITIAEDGKVWFTENNASSIGNLNPQTEAWQSFPVPSIPRNSSFPEIHAQMYGIAVDGAGNVWFTSWLGDQVVRFDPKASAFTPYIIGPEGIGSLGNKEPFLLLISGNAVWFSEYNGEGIGKLYLENGSVKSYPVGCRCPVGGLAAGPQGNIWFTIPESGAGKLGVFNPATGKIDVLQSVSFDNGQYYWENPTGIAIDSTGYLWVTDHASDTVYEFKPRSMAQNQSSIGYWNTLLPTAANRTEPFGIAIGRNGDVWFTESNANRIGMIDPYTRGLTEYLIPTPNSVPMSIAIDSAGRVWFTELSGNNLGMIDPSNPSPFSVSVSPMSTKFAQGGGVSLDVTLANSRTFRPGGPLKVWVVGIPSQYISYYIGKTAKLSDNRTELQLLLYSSNSLPPGRYTVTLSVSTSSLIQGKIIDVEVTGQGQLSILSGYAWVGAAVSGLVALAAVYGIKRYRRHAC
jgi:streptogramin lyase